MAQTIFVNKQDDNIRFIVENGTIQFDCLFDNPNYEILKLELNEEETKVKNEQEEKIPAKTKRTTAKKQE